MCVKEEFCAEKSRPEGFIARRRKQKRIFMIYWLIARRGICFFALRAKQSLNAIKQGGTKNVIELKGLTKEFEEKSKSRASASGGVFRAVDELSLKVEPGEIFGLLGSNGAGKTTTLRMLATMLKPTAGTAQIAGFDILTQPEQVRRSIGVLFGGDTGLYDRLSARENIQYFARLYDMDEEQINLRVEELCRTFEMKDYIDARCAKFSRGMKQKTAFARSIVHSPAVMLFDEPTAGLDITGRAGSAGFYFEMQGAGQDHNTLQSLYERGGKALRQSGHNNPRPAGGQRNDRRID